MNTEQLFEINAEWWKTPGSKGDDHPVAVLASGYDRDDILSENPDAGELIELNKYVITVDSQDYSCDSKFSTAHPDFIKWINQRYDKNYPEENTEALTLQVPYIGLILRTKDAKKIIRSSSFDNFYVAYFDGKKKYWNRLLGTRIEAGSKKVPLTSYLLMSRNRNSFEMMSPTNFQFNFQTELQELYRSRVVSDPEKLSIMYITGDKYCSPNYKLPYCVKDVVNLALNSDSLSISMSNIFSEIINLLSEPIDLSHVYEGRAQSRYLQSRSKKMILAIHGKTEAQGGLNLLDMKKYLAKIYPKDKHSIEKMSRSQANQYGLRVG